ncbi:MAG: hypothetical protein FJ109_09600, partial [Deltaproteobacteria bacterium]|nr:hypothetical protein [Deltaproteobacteria bacterium]
PCRHAAAPDHDHPLLHGKARVDLAELMAGEVFRGRRYYAPSIVGGTDLFGQVEGFLAVAAEKSDGSFPLILTARAGKGGVILLAASPDLLCTSGTPQSARTAGEDAMRNLLAFATRPDFDRGRPAVSVPRSPVVQAVTVFHDRNGNGVRDADDAGLPGTTLTYDYEDFLTDAAGRVAVPVDPWEPSLLFVRVPDGWTAEKWYLDMRDPGPHALGLQEARSDQGGGVGIAQLSDTHLGRIDLPEDRAVLSMFAADLSRRLGPDTLFAFTGDNTHTGSLAELEAFRSALPRGPQPVLTVMGNHDWGNGPDKGRLFREVLGPTHFAREWNGRLFVAVPRLETHARARRWLAGTIEGSHLPVVLLVHYFPKRSTFDKLPPDKVIAVLSGHWHGDMVTTRNGVVNINSPPALMGGWDFSPGSARVVRLDAGGVARADLVPMAWAALKAQGEGGEADRDRNGKAGPTSQEGREVGDGQPAPGRTSQDGNAATEAAADASQIARSPSDSGPEPVWTASVPGRVLLASPVVAGSRLLVPFRSTGTVGGDGGICALDLGAGTPEWCLSTAAGVANDLVVSGGTIVLAEVDGTVQGVAARDGAVRWRTRLDEAVRAEYVEHYLHSGAVLSKGVAYFCYQGGPFGVEVDSGRIAWTGEQFGGLDAFVHSRGVVVGDSLFCGAFLGGVYRYRLSGSGPAPRERLVKGNVTADLSAHEGLGVLTRDALLSLDPLSGKIGAKARVDYAVLPVAAAWGEFGPFVADGNEGVRRLGKRNGGRAWRLALPSGPLSFALNLREASGLIGSPVAVGRSVLVPGTDGVLRVVSAKSGLLTGGFDAGGPLVSTPAVHSGTAYVATYSGRVLAVPLGKKERN